MGGTVGGGPHGRAAAGADDGRAGDRDTHLPPGPTLGSDRYHPRNLLRLAPDLLEALLQIFVLCELLGAWPSVITDVLIALLPKPAGGLRPIGISPPSSGFGSA